MQRQISFVLLTGMIGAGLLGAARAQSGADLLNSGLHELEVAHFARAQQIFSLLVKQYPSAVNIGYLAVAESGAGQLSQAIVDFTRSINLGNDSLLVRYGLASTYLRNGETAPAARELRIVIARHPTYTPARYALGVALLKLTRPNEAIPFLEQARRQAPGDPQHWLTLVRARFDAGDSTAANQTAEGAMENFPDNRRLALELAQLCLRRQQTREARNLLETAVELQPGDAGTKLLLANLYLQAGEPSEALIILKSVPVETGERGEVMLLRGEAQALTGDLSSAQADLAAARADNPQNPAYTLVSAWLDQRQGRYRDALAVLSQMPPAHRGQPDVLYERAVNYFFLGNYAQTASTCKAAIRAQPLSDRTYLLLGLSQLETRDFSDAETAFERAIALKPRTAIYHRELGVALLEMGIFGKSERELTLALALDPQASTSYFWRAKVFIREGKPEKAIEDLEASTTLDPKFLEAYSELVKLYSAQGETGKAAEAWRAQKLLEKTGKPPARNPFLSLRELTGPLP